MAKNATKAGGKAAASKKKETKRDLVMGDSSITQKPAGRPLADENDDPMGDPLIDPESDEEEMYEPDLDELEAEDGEDLDDDEDEDELDDDASDIEMDDGVPLPSARAVSPSAVPMIGRDLNAATAPSATTAQSDITSLTNPNHASITVDKPTPYTYDAGNLLISDPNPLPTTTAANLEATLTATARDAAQSLLNHLLTVCPIHTQSTTSTSTSGVMMTLPPPSTLLPREKKVPAPKQPTKWELFAAKKGIGKNKRNNFDAPDRAGKMVFDKETGEWVKKWGYKGKNKDGENDWLVEIDEKAEKKAAAEGKDMVDPRNMKRAERIERVRRNERAQRANERKGRKNGRV